MARFTAPADTSGIHLSAGYFAAKKGVVEVPEDLTVGDRSGLAANGFTPAPSAEPKSKSKSETAPRRTRRKKAAAAQKPAQPKPEKPVSQE